MGDLSMKELSSLAMGYQDAVDKYWQILMEINKALNNENLTASQRINRAKVIIQNEIGGGNNVTR